MEFPMKGVEHKYIVTEVGNRVHCVVAGAGPPVLLLHGFPEFWYSFRYQIPALAAAGFRVIVPDTRGAGESEIVEASDKYMWNDIIGDIVAVLKGLNVTEKVLVIGHDWGAWFAGQLSRIRPDLVRAVVYLGFVPYTWRAQLTLVEDLRLVFGDEVYIHVFQEPGRAEALFAKEKTSSLMLAFLSRWSDDPQLRIPKVSSDKEEALPDWITSADLQFYADTFDKTGFTPSLNVYRNHKRSTELNAPFIDKILDHPSLLFKASRDIGYLHVSNFHTSLDPEEILAANKPQYPNLQKVVVIDANHFMHQEKHEEVNKVIIEFLISCPPS
ncbi:soluble epoxide hydrolase / lipid-phosphate phosphatase [Marchantia polymorpha subsp. ruderalis]